MKKGKPKAKHTPITNELIKLIKKNKWEGDFRKAIRANKKLDLPIIGWISTLEDYYDYLDGFIHWTPKESTRRFKIGV